MARYIARFVHKISPSNADVHDQPITLDTHPDLQSVANLGRALRKQGIDLGKLRDFRIEGNEQISVFFASTSPWHAIILTPEHLMAQFERARAETTAPTYTDFVLWVRTSEFHRTEQTWYHTEEPVSWDVARDRLIAAGIIDAKLAGQFGPGGWTLSVDATQAADLRRAGTAPAALP